MNGQTSSTFAFMIIVVAILLALKIIIRWRNKIKKEKNLYNK